MPIGCIRDLHGQMESVGSDESISECYYVCNNRIKEKKIDFIRAKYEADSHSKANWIKSFSWVYFNEPNYELKMPQRNNE